MPRQSSSPGSPRRGPGAGLFSSGRLRRSGSLRSARRIPTPAGEPMTWTSPSSMARFHEGKQARGVQGVLRRFSSGFSEFAGASPSRSALLVFFLVVSFFTALLTLPVMSRSGQVTPLHDALFVATSAVSVTGLTPVNTAEHWTFAGQLVILLAIQIGGLGILSMAALLTLAVSRRLGLRSKLVTQEGMTTGQLGEVGALLRVVVTTTFTLEGILALVLIPRFIDHTDGFWDGVWNGIFYAISAFNNAGFTIHPEGLAPYVQDPFIMWTLMVGVFAGALGFPVVMVLHRHRWRYHRWNLHTKLTVEMTLALMVIGAVLIGIFEWTNPATLGQFEPGERVQFSIFASIMTRSGGFDVYSINDQLPETLLLSDALMFVGGGSASTAGGIKVTTLAVMFLAILAEARGNKDVTAHGRTIAPGTMRVGISVLALGATLVLVATMALVAISDETLQRPLFEAISAFGTCGLSTGLSSELPPSGKYVLSALMFSGRVGTITFASALALRQRRNLYRYPEERPIIG